MSVKLVAATALTLAACAPAPELHGRVAFDRWVTEHVTTVHETITFERGDGSGLPLAAYYDSYTGTVHLDDQQLADVSPDYAEWAEIHEEGHAVAIAAGLFIGDGRCDSTGCPPAERAAQCVTEIVLERPPSGRIVDPAGYWDCPDDALATTRLAMEGIGAW